MREMRCTFYVDEGLKDMHVNVHVHVSLSEFVCFILLLVLTLANLECLEF